MSKRIYLDYAATTPLDPAVLEAMMPFFKDKFGNPSSAHQFGREAREAIDKARKQTADFFGCEPQEVIFNSGATESNNLALKGVIYKITQNSKVKSQNLPHIVTSQIEHHCVLDTCKNLQDAGFAEVTYLPVNKEGLVEISEVEKAIKENTVLVSIMYANNEIGTVQPIEEIGGMIKKINESRQQKIYFHSDAVQAANYLNCKVYSLNVDLLSISAHKFYGPKGVGALFIKKGTPIKKIQDGGAHEFDLRAGTYNTAGIVGLGAAIALINSKTAERIKKLRDKMIAGVLGSISDSRLNGSPEHRLANNANFSFPGAEGESIMMGLDLEGIAVSTGSACASENLQPSHVLIALGLRPEDSHTSIRVTLGRYTSEEEIENFLDVLPKIVERLRKISGTDASNNKKKLPDDFGC